MIEVNWIKTSERKPTREDGNTLRDVLVWFTGNTDTREWYAVAKLPGLYPYWARMPEFAPPKVERKFAPEWRELRADSWAGPKNIWLLCSLDGCKVGALHFYAQDAAAYGYTHWQPMVEPRVYEDEK
jgi:hypothetical protein